MRWTILLAAMLVVPMASGAAYMKLGSIKGEATDGMAADGHGEDIDVLAWSWGAHRTKGEVTLGDVVVVRELDKSSTKLMAQFESGEVMESFELGGGDRSSNYLIITLQDVQITSYEISSSASGVPQESITMSYSWVKMAIDGYGRDAADGSGGVSESITLEAGRA